MTKFVWIFGATAVGKNELISKILSNAEHPLIESLDLEQPILVSEDSLSLVQEAREGIENEIASYGDSANTVLIKGQGYDIDGRDIPRILSHNLPGEEFAYVYLDARADTLRCRRERRTKGNPARANSSDDQGARDDMFSKAKELESRGITWRWFNNDNSDFPVETTKKH